jgi:hypothetical protein
MYNCEIEIANLNLHWKFPFIISQLPVPSTEAFDYLVKGLQSAPQLVVCIMLFIGKHEFKQLVEVIDMTVINLRTNKFGMNT